MSLKASEVIPFCAAGEVVEGPDEGEEVTAREFEAVIAPRMEATTDGALTAL